MPLSRVRDFNNFGLIGNEAGVCEAAVCLWQRRIHDQVGGWNWGSSAGDWVPTPQDSNALYHQFNAVNGNYLYTFQSYLQLFVYDGAKRKTGDQQGAHLFVVCCHYSGAIANGQWLQVLEQMSRGDTLFLSLAGSDQVDGHAMGVYRGTDYIFVFDPNRGLYRGKGWDGCCSRNNLEDAAAYLQGEYEDKGWGDVVYLGNHLRA